MCNFSINTALLKQVVWSLLRLNCDLQHGCGNVWCFLESLLTREVNAVQCSINLTVDAGKTKQWADRQTPMDGQMDINYNYINFYVAHTPEIQINAMYNKKYAFKIKLNIKNIR